MVEKHHLTQILKQVECMLSQQERFPVISKSNVNNSLAIFSGTSISQALAADDSMDQQTDVIPEGTSRGELSKFGGRRSLYITTWLSEADPIILAKSVLLLRFND